MIIVSFIRMASKTWREILCTKRFRHCFIDTIIDEDGFFNDLAFLEILDQILTGCGNE